MDFESFSYCFAKQPRLPLISIDNMQVMSRCTLNIAVPKQEQASYAIAKNIVRSKVPRSDHYLISSFFDVPVCKERTLIIGREILEAEPSAGSHVLVYQTSTSRPIW